MQIIEVPSKSKSIDLLRRVQCNLVQVDQTLAARKTQSLRRAGAIDDSAFFPPGFNRDRRDSLLTPNTHLLQQAAEPVNATFLLQIHVSNVLATAFKYLATTNNAPESGRRTWNHGRQIHSLPATFSLRPFANSTPCARAHIETKAIYNTADATTPALAPI